MVLDSPKQNLPNKPIRLQRYLAECGLGSRRACEQIIAQGVVSVDGKPVTTQGVCIHPFKQQILVHKKCVRPQEKLYILLNKPTGVLCTSKDPQGRRIFRDLVKDLPSYNQDLPSRLYTAGRLDLNSEGLVFITNDGNLAYQLTHPKHHIPRRYHVWINRPLTAQQILRFKKGIPSSEGLLTADRVIRKTKKGICYEITLLQGKNRQIRRMMKAVHIEINRLKRIAIGPLQLGSLKVGAWRHVKAKELQAAGLKVKG